MTDTAPQPDTEPTPPSLSDYAASAAPQTEPEPLESVYREPYTDAELAQTAAALTSFGIPENVQEAYIKKFTERVAPGLALLEAGEAAAAMGFHKGGGGVGELPAWVRLVAAGVGIGAGAYFTRREFVSEKAPSDPSVFSSGLDSGA